MFGKITFAAALIASCSAIKMTQKHHPEPCAADDLCCINGRKCFKSEGEDVLACDFVHAEENECLPPPPPREELGLAQQDKCNFDNCCHYSADCLEEIDRNANWGICSKLTGSSECLNGFNLHPWCEDGAP